MKAQLNTSRITPKKANLIAGMLREKSANEALEILKYTPKKAAKILYKLLNSAVSNAESNFKQDKASLVVKEIIINKGPTLKRGVSVSKGRVHPILKRTSHITVLLDITTVEEAKKTSKESTKSEKTKSIAKKTTKKVTTKK